MEHAKTCVAAVARGLGVPALVLAAGALGLAMAHQPMIFSGFTRIQTDLTDSRLNHYVLEHGYLWMRGATGHREFWNMPFFYPVPNTAAHSDVLLSVGPVYWFWRVWGASADQAFAWWMVSMSALNYAAGLLLFRKGLHFEWLPATAAAFLVAFGAPRVNHLTHPQLLPCFYLLAAVFAVVRLFDNAPTRWGIRAAYWLLAVSASVLQLYCGFYQAWFLVAGMGLAVVAALLLRSCRGMLLAVLKRDAWAIAAACGIGVVMAAPLVRHYLPVSQVVAMRQAAGVYSAFTPRVWSWFNVGANHWVWGWTARREPFRGLGLPPEHILGIGFLTTLACGFGLYVERQRPVCRLAAALVIAMPLATTHLPDGQRLALLATAVCFFCMAGLYREVSSPRDRGLALGSLLVVLCLVRFPTEDLQALALFGMILSSLELVRTRGDVAKQFVPAVALLVFCLRLFAVQAVVIGIFLAAPVAGLVARYWPAGRKEVGAGLLIFPGFFPVILTLPDHPGLYAGAAAGAVIALAASAPGRLRPPSWLMLRVLIVCLPVIIIFFWGDCLWLTVYRKLPGGVGIRVVGRIILIMLIPAALGLASLIQWLVRAQRRVAAAAVCLACALEQGVTTETFDAAASRAKIANVAEQVMPGYRAFYYHPCPDPNYFATQIDAMWAGLAAGVPTINGYSGYFPPAWDGFFAMGFNNKIDPRVELDKWERANGLSAGEVQWIGSEKPCQTPNELTTEDRLKH